MAVTSSAIASPQQLYQDQPATTVGSLFTAPAYISGGNVSDPSSTMYITEILAVNSSGGVADAQVYMGGTAASNLIAWIHFDDNDTYRLELKTMMPAAAVVYGVQSVSGAITLTISGAAVA